jgi:hypothetical protein
MLLVIIENNFMTLQEKDFTSEKLVCVLKNHKTTIS